MPAPIRRRVKCSKCTRVVPQYVCVIEGVSESFEFDWKLDWNWNQCVPSHASKICITVDECEACACLESHANADGECDSRVDSLLFHKCSTGAMPVINTDQREDNITCS